MCGCLLHIPYQGGGTWPVTQSCALTGNWTSNPLVCSLVLNPLSHNSQGSPVFLIIAILTRFYIFVFCILRRNLIVVLICISSFNVPIGHLHIFAKMSAHFLLFFCYWAPCVSYFFYFLDINILLYMWFANIFFHLQKDGTSVCS